MKEIAGAAILQPDAEQSLVDAAGDQPLNVLQAPVQAGAGRRSRLRSATYEAIRRNRYLRNWVEDNGAVRLDARLTPDDGARLLASVGAEADSMATAARRAGVDEPRRALAADALVALAGGAHRVGRTDAPGGRPATGPGPTAGGSGTTSEPSTVVHVRVDHAALLRGRVEGDELCEIPGVGPDPGRGRPPPGGRRLPPRPRHRRGRRHLGEPGRAHRSGRPAPGPGRARPGVRGPRVRRHGRSSRSTTSDRSPTGVR